MPGLDIIISAVLMIFGIIGMGGLFRKVGALPERADGGINKLVFNLFYPALIADKILGNEALGYAANLWQAPLVGMFHVLIGFGVCWLVAKAIRLRDPREVGGFSATVGIFNYGFIPLPLIMTLFDEATVGALFLHNVGVEILIWTLGVLLIGGGGSGSWKRVFNLPMASIAVSILLTVFELDGYIPTALRNGLQMVGGCSIPVALIMIGALMADLIDWQLMRSRWRVVIASCVTRLALLPGLMLVGMVFLPVSLEVKRVIMIQAAMPTAVFPVIIARYYGGHLPTAVRVIVATSLVSLVTMPLWIRVGFWLLETYCLVDAVSDAPVVGP